MAKGNAMESEKIVYWMTLGVLAMAAVTGVVTEHRGWSDRVADRTIAMMSRASENAMNYAEIAGMVLGGGERNPARPQRVVVDVPNHVQADVQRYVQADVQNRLACVQRGLVRRQAEMARSQALRVQLRILERAPRTVVWPNPNIVIDIPQSPQVQVGTF
jgi:hypothetical protein